MERAESQPFAIKRHWADNKLHLEYLEHLRQQLGGSLESLYSLSNSDIIRIGGMPTFVYNYITFYRQVTGAPVLSMYNQSVAQLVMSAYPLHAWRVWKFRCAPRNWWKLLAIRFASGSNEEANAIVRLYMEDLAERLNINELRDWYNVTAEQLGSTDLLHLKILGKLPAVLKRIHPSHQWKLNLFTFNKKRSVEKRLQRQVDVLLP